MLTGRRAAAARLGWGLVAVVGYILSPLSPWNDAFVNIPIAYAVSRLLRPLGVPGPLGFYLGYLASNLLGLLLLSAGAQGVKGARAGDRVSVWRLLLGSLAYSVAAYLVLALLGLA